MTYGYVDLEQKMEIIEEDNFFERTDKTYKETYLKTESDDQESSVVIMGR